MALPKTDFPAIRACIFDMDGLLINTEDIITTSTNLILQKYNRPPLTPSVRAQLTGIPNSTNGDTFHAWAQLPIPRSQYALEQSTETYRTFPTCKPMPGAAALLQNLGLARSVSTGEMIELALASSTKRATFELKTQREEIRGLLGAFGEERRVLGDDGRVKKGRGKPAPDVYLAALGAINDSLSATSGPSTEKEEEEKQERKPIMPNECLVFEDSIVGVEAGRRAGMRVVWVPHVDLVDEYRGMWEQILAGRTGMVRIVDGDEGQVGEVGDGWAESLESLEGFDYEKYGIEIPS
ncbi:HAD-like domain-containing protein [Cadophora sp. MPI-SDFR-AT-0126]|nr:HAD-like domain-containing protein [Leotiomycetes sp. MPI-SDFR-AT-0126]